ncbi:MAG: NAD(P)H-hydrate dehydratase [Chloroflexi bacterium]|nr:NAD(P)H-hydrate dehydratase [Chloroflexota bacterium]
MKLASIEQMRKAEEIAQSYGISESYMMSKVADAVCERACEILFNHPHPKAIVICGNGKNGYDALLSCTCLHKNNIYTAIFAVAPLPQVDGLLDGFYNLTYIKDKIDLNSFKNELKEAYLVIDGLFGNGLSHSVSGINADIISSLNTAHAQSLDMHVLSIDLPSGLNADNGTIWGNCVVADQTLCCGLVKIGLFQNDGPLYSGKVSVCDIGLPAQAAQDIKITLIDRDLAWQLLPARSPLICKNGFGKALIIGGSASYVGAPVLAACGAAKSGAGITTLVQPQSIYLSTVAAVPFATHIPADDLDGHFTAASAFLVSGYLDKYNAVAIGCGIALERQALQFMWHILQKASQTAISTVVDAGALSMLAQTENAFDQLDGVMALTPHAGEMSCLTGLDVDYINQNKLSVASQYAALWNKVILLKGPNTVIAAPNGECYVSSFANSALAVGGSGDVLAGSIASLAAQGLGLFDACALAVYLQGASAALCVKENGHRGITPDVMVNYIPLAFSQLERE